MSDSDLIDRLLFVAHQQWVGGSTNDNTGELAEVRNELEQRLEQKQNDN